MGVPRRTLPLAAAVLLTASGTACSSAQNHSAAPAPAMRLVAYDSCQALLKDLRAATAGQVGPYGLNGAGVMMPLRRSAPMAVDDGSAVAGSTYSGTNVQ